MILEIIFLLIGLFFLLILVISAVLGVPFLPTHRKQAELMMELVSVDKNTVMVDLGSGAGRLLFAAAKRGARAVGYELNPFLYFWTKAIIFLKGYSGRVTVRCQSLYSAELGEATVVTAFLLNGPMKKLEGKLWSELKPGAKIVSYTFPIPGRQYTIKEQGIYVYEV